VTEEWTVQYDNTFFYPIATALTHTFTSTGSATRVGVQRKTEADAT